MTYYTHSGYFHCDEVAGYAICLMAGVCNELARVTDMSLLPEIKNSLRNGHWLKSDILADIGREYDHTRGLFDHHQKMIYRIDGHPLATAGLLWNKYGKEAIRSTLGLSHPSAIDFIYNRVAEKIIKGIDANDCDNEYAVNATCCAGAVNVLTLPDIVRSLNGDDPQDHQKQLGQFEVATRLVHAILKKEMHVSHAVFETYQDFSGVSRMENGVIILSKNLPWQEVVSDIYPAAKFIITPSNHPGSKYALTAIPVEPGSRLVKQPIEKRGEFTGFIHEGKWIAGSDSLGELMQLALLNSNSNDYESKV